MKTPKRKNQTVTQVPKNQVETMMLTLTQNQDHWEVLEVKAFAKVCSSGESKSARPVGATASKVSASLDEVVPTRSSESPWEVEARYSQPAAISLAMPPLSSAPWR